MLTKPRSSHTDFINKIREDLSMNRENKRKQYQNGYYKNHRCDDTFTCKHCGRGGKDAVNVCGAARLHGRVRAPRLAKRHHKP